MFFRKRFLPWTLSEQFQTREEFQDFLKFSQKQLTNQRIFWLIPAALCLLIGYCLDLRPIMILTVLPLVLVLLLSIALDRTEAAMDGQDKSQQQ